MKLHKEIKRVRNEYGNNQTQFAEAIGVSRVHYSNLESGRINITINILERIASVTKKKLIITFIDL